MLTPPGAAVDNKTRAIDNRTMYKRRGIILSTLFFAVLFLACSSEKQGGMAGITAAAAPRDRAPRYLIKFSGNSPFYFELSPGGPRLIPAPAEASLNPFVPWTQSRHISHILPISGDHGEVLYAAVNRGGILELAESAGETAIHYTPGGGSWEQYPLAAFFRHKQKPAALLARDRFFSAEAQNPPAAAAWAMSEHHSIEAINVPALAADPPWESAGLFLGQDQHWYIRKINTENKNAYFRSADVSRPGEPLDVESYLAAASPLEAGDSSVPPLLARVLDEAASLAGKSCAASVVSPVFPAERLFAPASTGSIVPENPSAEINVENAAELSGYYRPPDQGKGEAAIILFPDGRGLYGVSAGGGEEIIRLNLPALPPGNFSYTGIALVNRGAESAALKAGSHLLLFASWEEQDNWNIGAAGFVVLEIER